MFLAGHLGQPQVTGTMRTTALAVALALLPACNRPSEAGTTMQSATSSSGANHAIRPFTVHFPDEALADMRRRITATRWPPREIVADQSQGVQLATMQKLASYWATDYDWRKAEAKLDALPQ